jgi:hypothetical protein
MDLSNSSSTDNTIHWNWYNDLNDAQTVFYPASVAIPNFEPKQKPDDPLDWLREQTIEICELASAR